ncbi:MAG: Ig-like domain-containing protein [Pseudohongiella sp.]|nr:Ig-like domain-containing protein [Pseudohongiella sp.]
MKKLAELKFHSRPLAWGTLCAGLLLTACGGGGDGGRDPILGGGGTAVLIPMVSAVTPAPNTTGVAFNTSVVTATFNKSMNPATLTASSFSLACPMSTPIAGTVSYAATTNVATLALGRTLPGNTVCTATVAASVSDTTGNTIVNPYVWTFTTGATPETVPPTVSSTAPVRSATDVAVDRRMIVSFSEPMNPLTIVPANFSLVCPTGTVIPGTVDYTVVGNVATLTPSRNLPFSAACSVTVGTGVKDVAGNSMAAAYNWTFNTSAAPDTTAPTVISTLPRSAALLVPVNSLISATFSEAMTPLTITASNFTVDCPSTAPIAGTVGYAVNGNVATFTPNANLPGNTICRATVSTGVKDLAGLSMASNYTWNFTTGPTPDLTAPTVSTTVPARNATAVRINTQVSASFSEPMNPLTITTANFSVVCPIGAPITGLVAYAVDGNVATFTPASTLPPSSTCRATIVNGVKDVAGNSMLTNYTWDFQTGLTPDTTAPTVTLTVPVSNATNVALNSLITARFSEAMDPLTITSPQTFSVACPTGSPVTGIVSYAVSSNTATFTPGSTLPASTICRATVNNTVKDTAGNRMVNVYNWNFTTGAGPDVSPPTVIGRFPAAGASNVPVNTTVSATFNEAMDPLTMLTSNFTLAQGLNPVSGQISFDPLSNIATFTPDASLNTGTTYQFIVRNTVKDIAGNAMVMNDIWNFSTGGGLAPGAVSLGNAAGFGIMATSAITSTGATQVNGDVSLEPGTSQGIPPPQVSGTIHVNDATSSKARADLLTAYNNLKTLPPGITVLGGTDLGATFPGSAGMAPGTYTSGSTMLITTPVTLNGGGNSNAVWVFQIGSSLTTTANIVLVNGAQAKNIFWVPTQDATIGVGTTFFGNVIAGRDTTAQTGATVNGRILSGAITAGTIALDSTTVNVPAP